MFIVTDPKYNRGILLDEYNGRYSLVQARQGESKVFVQWCKPKQGDDKYASKDLPLGVRLGSKDEAVKILKNFIAAIQGGYENEGEGSRPTNTDTDDLDIPF